jgi:TM2 domain-containing membrane protein YozV
MRKSGVVMQAPHNAPQQVMQQVPQQQVMQQVPQQQVVYVQQAPMMNIKNSGLSILLAFIWPGLDYIYLEDGAGGVKRAIGCVFLYVTLIGIPVALVIWIMGMVSSSQRTAQYNNNLMMQSQGMMPNQPIIQQ